MIRRLARYFSAYSKHLAISIFFIILFAVTSGVFVYLATSVITSIFEPSGLTAAAEQPVDASPTGFFDGVKSKGAELLHDLLLTGDRLKDLRNLCLALLLVALIKNAFFYLQGFFAAHVEQGITRDLRNDIYKHLLKLSLNYFHKKRTGELMSTATNDVYKIHETFNNTINNLIRDPILVMIYLFIMVVVSWKMTLLSAVVFPIIFYLVVKVSKLVRRYSARAQEALADVSSSLEETVSNIRIVRAYSAERHEEKKFMERTGSYFHTMIKINRARLISTPLNEVLGVAAVVVVLWYAGQLVLKEQLLDPQSFLLFLFSMFAIITPAKSFSSVHIRINEGLAAAKRIFDLLDCQPDVVEVASPTVIERMENTISYENVSFSYQAGEKVLDKINFQMNRGEIVALVGPSGAGKSTIVDLLCRFYDPQEGQILVDGIDLRQVSLKSLRDLLGVVTQETILFNDTVARNICYPNGNADRKRLESATRAANAHEFIMEMPNGYDTVIGNRGMMVSGGERQRLAIARALMKDPQILVFDEATSALDTESERLVQEAIERLMKGRTSIVIAHRLSTILNADKILVIKDGTIAEQGTHHELMKVDGVYRRLYDLQFENSNAKTTGKKVAATGTNSQRD